MCTPLFPSAAPVVAQLMLAPAGSGCLAKMGVGVPDLGYAVTAGSDFASVAVQTTVTPVLLPGEVGLGPNQAVVTLSCINLRGPTPVPGVLTWSSPDVYGVSVLVWGPVVLDLGATSQFLMEGTKADGLYYNVPCYLRPYYGPPPTTSVVGSFLVTSAVSGAARSKNQVLSAAWVDLNVAQSAGDFVTTLPLLWTIVQGWSPAPVTSGIPDACVRLCG